MLARRVDRLGATVQVAETYLHIISLSEYLIYSAITDRSYRGQTSYRREEPDTSKKKI